jgi:hypothetical protein
MLLVTTVPYYVTIPYLIIWLCFGNYVLLNLFLGVLLDGFDVDFLTDDVAMLE